MLKDDEIDAVLSTRIPGGSAARDWFLPHETPQGLANVRTVVRAMIDAAPQPVAPPDRCPTYATTSGNHVICRRCGEVWPPGQDNACVRAAHLLNRIKGVKP